MTVAPEPYDIRDFVPGIDIGRDIERAVIEPTPKRIASAVITAGTDALGFGVGSSLFKLATRGSKYAKLLKARGFKPITTDGSTLIKTGLKQTPINAGKFGTIGYKAEPYVITKQVPTFKFNSKNIDPKALGFSLAIPTGLIGAGLSVAPTLEKIDEITSKKQKTTEKKSIKKHQKGTKMLPTAPKAEDRYKNSIKINKTVGANHPVLNDSTTIKTVKANKSWFGEKPAMISEVVDHSSLGPEYNDTLYVEVPEVSNPLLKQIPRATYKVTPFFGNPKYVGMDTFFGFWPNTNVKSTPEEYKTLQNRFKTSWNLAK